MEQTVFIDVHAIADPHLYRSTVGGHVKDAHCTINSGRTIFVRYIIHDVFDQFIIMHNSQWFRRFFIFVDCDTIEYAVGIRL